MNSTCLIPFFNEHSRILKVLDQVAMVEALDQIVCVDDGSIDGTAELVTKQYPGIKLVINPKNLS